MTLDKDLEKFIVRAAVMLSLTKGTENYKKIYNSAINHLMKVATKDDATRFMDKVVCPMANEELRTMAVNTYNEMKR